MDKHREFSFGRATVAGHVPTHAAQPPDMTHMLDSDILAAAYIQTSELTSRWAPTLETNMRNLSEDIDVLTEHIRGLTYTVVGSFCALLIGGLITVMATSR